jgi:phosphatidylglycerol---prolipoprotein diacylglyceryl transferase
VLVGFWYRFPAMNVDPVAFHIGGRPIYWYGICVAVAFVAAVAHWTRLARKEKKPEGFGSEIGFWMMLSGIVGARVAYGLANFAYFAAAPIEIFRVDRGGIIFYGGFLGALLGLILFARRRKEPFWRLTDFTVTGLPLGHAIGRVGCFLNNCCYGCATAVPWGVERDGVVRQPVQLYEFAFNMALYGLLLWAYPRRKADGRVFALYLMVYPAGRFLFEFLRGDDRLCWLGMNVAQEVSLALFAAGVALWFARKKKE